MTTNPVNFDNTNNEENIDCAAPIFAAPARIQDKYLESTEAKYHNVDNMIYSDNVLRNEKEICEEIIKFKKENDYDYNLWSKKIQKINNYLFLDLNKEKNTNKHKAAIDNQMRKEKDLLFEMEKDSNLKEFEIPSVKERIIKRILIVRKEIEELNNPSEQPINKNIIQKQVYPSPIIESHSMNQQNKIQSYPSVTISKKVVSTNKNLLPFANKRLSEYREVAHFFEKKSII